MESLLKNLFECLENETSFSLTSNSLIEELALGFFIDYETLADEYRKGLKVQNLGGFIPESLSREEKLIHLTLSHLRQKNSAIIFEKIPDKNFKKPLEIGSGPLHANGSSFLTSPLSKSKRKNFLYLEVNPKIISSIKSLVKNPPLIEGDLLNLERLFKGEAFSMIAGSNILDTLSKQDLEKAFKEAHAVLKNEGLLVHLLNLEPFIYSILHTFSKNKALFIPNLGYENRGFVLVEDLEKSGFTSLETEVLKFIEGLNPLEKEHFFNASLKLNNGRALSKLSEKILKRHPEALLPFTKIFSDWIHLISKEIGFKLIEEGCVSSRKKLDLPVDSSYKEQLIHIGPMGKKITKNEKTSFLEAETYFFILKK